MWQWCYGHIKSCTHGNYRSWVLSRHPVFTCLIYVIALSVPICSCALWQMGLQFSNTWKCCQFQGIRLGFYLIASFFVCYKLVLRDKRLTPGSREALSSQAANNLWVQLKVERSKLQVEHLCPKCISLSHMQARQLQGGCAGNEADLRTPHLCFCTHGQSVTGTSCEGCWSRTESAKMSSYLSGP